MLYDRYATSNMNIIPEHRLRSALSVENSLMAVLNILTPLMGSLSFFDNLAFSFFFFPLYVFFLALVISLVCEFHGMNFCSIMVDLMLLFNVRFCFKKDSRN